MKAEAEALRELGLRAARAVLGVDRLCLAQKSPEELASPDILERETPVAVDLSGLAPEPFASWEEARRAWRRLGQAADALETPDRRQFYRDLARAMAALVDWQEAGGGHEPAHRFAERGAALLGLDRLLFREDEWEAARRRLAGRLEASGVPVAGLDAPSLAEAVRRWEEPRLLAPDEALSTLADLLAWGREAAARLFDLADLPPMRAVAVRGVSYNAYCDYAQREMLVNFDERYTRAALRHLVAHEAYPGHTTHLALREAAAREGRATADTLLVVTDTPTSPVFEGIADNGLFFLDAADDDDLTYLALEELRTLAACRAAARLAAGTAPDEVAARLAEEAAASPAWTAHRMRFLARPLRRPFIFAYAWGRLAVGQAYRRVAERRRGEFLRRLYENPHSPRSLALLGEELAHAD